MQPVWLFEARVYRSEANPLRVAIRRRGMVAVDVPHRSIGRGEIAVGNRPLGPDACVIGYGTYPFAREMQLHRAWRPGAWCSPTDLDCTGYYPRLGGLLLNHVYEILPGAEAIRTADRLFAIHGRGDRVFVRPAACDKHFVGRVVSRATFADALSPTRYDPTTLVLVAAPRSIAREWRLVVAGDRVVAASRYAVGGVRSVEPGAPDDVRAFAAEVLATVAWRPDPIFMLDVAESEGRLAIVELNGFSSSWLYACDADAVVSEAGRLAAEIRRLAPDRSPLPERSA